MKISLPLFVATLISLGTFAGLTAARFTLSSSLQKVHEFELLEIGEETKANVQNSFTSLSGALLDSIQKQTYEESFVKAIDADDRNNVIEDVLTFSTQKLSLPSIKTYINKGNKIGWIDDAEFYSTGPPNRSLIELIEQTSTSYSAQFMTPKIRGLRTQIFVVSADIPDPSLFGIQGQLRTVFEFSPGSPLAEEFLSLAKVDCIRIFSDDGIDLLVGETECMNKLTETQASTAVATQTASVSETDFLVIAGDLSTDFRFSRLKFVSGATNSIVSSQSQQLETTLNYVAFTLILSGVLTTTITVILTRFSVQKLLRFIGQDLTKSTTPFEGSYIGELETIASTHQKVTDDLRREMLERITAEDNVEVLSHKVRSAHSDKMEALGTLTAGVAHDFNNLLAIILGNLELIKEDLRVCDVYKDNIKDMFESSNRAAALVSDLLQYARNEPYKKEINDIRDIIVGLKKIIATALGPQIEMHYVIEGDTSYLVNIDADKCTSALLNLVTNARDAMNDGGSLTISLRKEVDTKNPMSESSEHCVIEIEDTGIGIPSDKIDQIFNPFFTTKAIGKGTGLGLSLVHTFVEQSHGAIDIQSEIGRGTKFIIKLPISNGLQIKESLIQDTAKKSLEGINILVVDDEIALCKIMELALKRTGARIVSSYSTQGAISELKSKASGYYQVLITDVLLGDGNGTEIINMCTEQLIDSNIIFVSGNSSLDDCSSKIDFDRHVSFIQKPFETTELINKISQVLKLESAEAL